MGLLGLGRARKNGQKLKNIYKNKRNGKQNSISNI